MTTASERRPMSLVQKGLAVIGLSLVGGAAGYVAAGLTDLESAAGGWADSLAVAMAYALFTIAILSAVTLAVRPAAIPKGCGILQVVVFALAGLMFLAPMYPPAFVTPGAVFAGVAVVFAVQTVANLMLWRRADEMLRRVMSETSAMAFWALQTALFLYAAAERLGLVETISAWGMTGILMAVYLMASIVAAARRGIA